jgi:hypothetical protein
MIDHIRTLTSTVLALQDRIIKLELMLKNPIRFELTQIPEREGSWYRMTPLNKSD